MPRGPRLDTPGALHHVIARGIERGRIFHRVRDRHGFLHRLAELTSDSGANLLAWCLMPNHIHLLWRTGRLRLSAAMQSLLGGYADTFNRRHRRSGHLFQNRFKSILIEDQPYLLELVRYIHLNPLRARLVADLDALAAYPWTGHAVLLGHRTYAGQDIMSVLSLFGTEVHVARQSYQQFVAQGVTEPPAVDVSGGGLRRSASGWTTRTPLPRGREGWSFDERILGSGVFVDQVRATMPSALPPVVQPVSRTCALLLTLCQRVGDTVGVAPIAIASRSCAPPVVIARSLVSYLAVTHYGLSLVQVARALNISAPTVLRGRRRGPQLLTTLGYDARQLLPRPEP